MNKIALFENTRMLNRRIEQILSTYYENRIHTYSNTMIDKGNVQKLLEDVNLIIMDFDSYDVNRIEMLRGIRAAEPERRLPIIVLSSKVNRKMIVDLAQIRDIEILSKPFDDVALLQKVLKYRNIKLNYAQDEHKSESVVAYQDHLIEWDDRFKIGHEIIDMEHKGLMDQFTRLYKLMRDGRGHEYYSDMLKFLDEYVQNHFEHEEHLLKEIGYDKLRGHQILHKNFTDKVKEIVHAHDGNPVDNLELIRINLFIKKWLVHHILVEDRKIGDFLEAQLREVHLMGTQKPDV